MTLIWTTDTYLGEFAVDHPFDTDPVVINFIADFGTTVTLISGNLPEGLSWKAYPNFIKITGQPVLSSGANETFSFIFQIQDIIGNKSEKYFTIDIDAAPVPQWETPAKLGSYPANYSFNINPLYIRFKADRSAVVSLINGSIPSGLHWSASNGNIKVTNSVINVDTETDWSWTFRVQNPNGTLIDRTFMMTTTFPAPYPNWEGQTQLLGYVGSNEYKKFKVSATITSNEDITYSFVNSVDPRLGLDGYSGEIFFNNLNYTVANDLIDSFIVRATAMDSKNYSDITLSIKEVQSPHLPVWTTSSDLYTVVQGTYLKIPLNAYDPLGGPVTYSFSPSSESSKFLLDPQGLLYGEAPIIKQDQLYTLVITASVTHQDPETFLPVVYTADQTFLIKVVISKVSELLRWRNTDNNLSVVDGTRIVFDIGATSERTETIKHGITGGQCPPGIMLDKIQGYLVGFVDYHCFDKEYYFDIVATDDVDTITRTIHMHVKANYGYQFGEIRIPLTGDLRQRWLTTSNFIMTNGGINPNVDVVGNTLFQPSMSLIKGINHTLDRPEQIIQSIFNGLQQLTLSIGEPNTVVTNSNLDTLLYRSIQDEQESADLQVVYPVPGYDTAGYYIRPASLNSLRNIFIERCGFANSGSGSGASATASADSETGAINVVNLSSVGSGYITAPVVTVNGQGSGAELKSYISLTNIRVIDNSKLWYMGEIYTLNIGEYIRPAQFIISETFPSSSIKTIEIIDGGLYTKAPTGKIWIFNQAGNRTGISTDFSVAEIEIVKGGSGYISSSTTISLKGSEILPSWQSKWEPYIPIALSTKSFANTVINNSELAITRVLDGVYWQIGDLEYTVQGLFWQGSTKFSNDDMSFDGVSTKFEEYLEPHQTAFDTSYETFDKNFTTFDVGNGPSRDARINWGRTIIDEGTTAFEFYSTIYDAVKAPTESSTIVKRTITLNQEVIPYIPTKPPEPVPVPPVEPVYPPTFIGSVSINYVTNVAIHPTLPVYDCIGETVVSLETTNLVLPGIPPYPIISKVNPTGVLGYPRYVEWIEGFIPEFGYHIGTKTVDIGRNSYITLNVNTIENPNTFAAIVKFTPGLDLIWQTSLSLNEIKELELLDDGSLIAVSLYNPDLTKNINIVKLNSQSQILWNITIPNSNYDDVRLVKSPVGFVIAAKHSNYVDIMKFDFDGISQWSTRLDDDINTINTFDIICNSSDRIFCTLSTTVVSPIYNTFVFVLDNNGNMVWQKVVNQMSNDAGAVSWVPSSITVDYKNNIYIAGQINDQSSVNIDRSALLICINKTGSIVWQNKFRNVSNYGYVYMNELHSIKYFNNYVAVTAAVGKYDFPNTYSVMTGYIPSDGSQSGKQLLSIIYEPSNLIGLSDGFLYQNTFVIETSPGILDVYTPNVHVETATIHINTDIVSMSS
jgi:hypothetical protein